jgi:hypothetical protein
MDQGYFWLNDVQFERLEAHLPTDARGKPRVDDRRVSSGIVHVPLSGCRRKDAPAVCCAGSRYPRPRTQPLVVGGGGSRPCPGTPHFHELAAASAPGLLAIVERVHAGTPATPSLPQSVAMNSATMASGWPVGL